MEEQWDFYFQYGTWHKPNRNIKIPAKDLRDKSKGFFLVQNKSRITPSDSDGSGISQISKKNSI